MKLTKLLLSFFLLPSLVTCDPGDHHHDDDGSHLTWQVLEVTLPKPLSDFTATLGSEGVAYVAGGCDSTKGNEYLAEEGFFVCASITNTFYAFDIPSETFTTLAPLLRPRYRHGAALVKNKIWLVGGRDIDDNLIPEIDVYDIASNTWSSVGSLPDAYVTSDHGVFEGSDDSFVYVVGGYDENYTSYDTTVRFRTDISGLLDASSFERMASVNTARGDVSAVRDGSYAYVSGGFTHTNDFCDALDSVERYEFATNTWTTVAPLNTPRADKALVVMENKLYAVGGERQIENICQIATEDLPVAGEQTVAVDDVEVFTGEEWKILASLPNHRFRFAAVAFGGTIYTFGGQVGYDNDCQCFATTDEVVAYTESGATAKSKDIVVIGLMITVAATLL